MSRLKISLLGPVQVTQDNRPLTGFEYDKVRALLAYLALEADRPHRREALAGLLWPDQPEKAARDGLRNALATLRKAIGDDAADPPYLFITREAVQFNASSDYVLDAAEFIRLLRHANHHRHRNPDTCRVCAAWRQEAAGLYNGPLLVQFSLADSPEFENWLVTRREGLHREAMDSFARLADYHLRHSDYGAAQYFAGRQLAYEPWREAAHRQAMLALAQQGDRAGALRQFLLGRHVLEEEIGVQPEAETVFLFERIRDGDGVLRPVPRTIPDPASPLIGREGDLAALGRRLADPGVRLVTITGPGGVGKTSLAQAAGHRFGGDFADGAVFVSLMATPDSASIFPAIAAALGQELDPALPVEAQVSAYLRSLEMLLVLDNFEHVIDGVGLLTDLLAGAPRLVLLVTSRQRLSLAAEWLYELQGLAFPAEDSGGQLAEFSAIQLFARRARQERGDFALLSSEALAAADICRLVQGMPLAIELAAAATGVQSTAEIARQLRSGLDALAADWADLPPRHRSVRAALEHSWSMLSDDERRVLRRLSVFSGGFDSAAGEAVAGAVPADLRRLRNKSLLQIREGDRFDLHPLIRAYAAERLSALGETVETARRHLSYCTTMAEQGEQALKGCEQLVWLRRLETDHANLLAALAWAEENDYLGAARLAAAMWLFWFMRGHLLESRHHYEHLFPGRKSLPVHSRARLVNGYASTLMGQGDFEALEPVAREGLAGYRDAGDDEGIALSYHHLAISVRAKAAYDEAVTYLNEGITPARRIAAATSTWVLTVVQDTLASTLMMWGRFAEAEVLVREIEPLSLQRGDRWVWAYALLRLAGVAAHAGDLTAARSEYEKSLAVAEEYGDRRLILSCSIYLGKIALRGGDLAEAWRRAETAERYSHEVGDHASRAKALETLGDILARRGFTAEAALRYREARETFAAAGHEEAAGRVAGKLSS